jgi:tetratricopeptide (TPR) repeat protein
MRRIIAAIPTALVVTAVIAPCAGAADDKEEARIHFDKGVVLVEQENWEAALIEFEESLALYPTKGAHFNRAMCLKALYRYVDALDAFEEYLSRYSPPEDDPRRIEAEKSIEEILSLLGSLRVEVNVDGAGILVDSEPAGTSPLPDPIALSPGYHTVRVEAEGFVPEERDIKVIAGDARLVEIYLGPVPSVGFVTVESNVEGADVMVDGLKVGVTPHTGELSVGEHTITVEKKYHKTYEARIDLKLNQKRLIAAELVNRRTLGRAWFWSVTGLAIASTLSTVSTGIAVTILDGRYDPYASTRADYDTGRRLMIATDVMLAVAVGSAVASLVLYFFTDWSGRAVEERSTALIVIDGRADLAWRF